MSFRAQRGISRLRSYWVYYQEFDDINQAIEIEKKLKGWRRDKKIDFIRSFNPEMKDLTGSLI